MKEKIVFCFCFEIFSLFLCATWTSMHFSFVSFVILKIQKRISIHSTVEMSSYIYPYHIPFHRSCIIGIFVGSTHLDASYCDFLKDDNFFSLRLTYIYSLVFILPYVGIVVGRGGINSFPIILDSNLYIFFFASSIFTRAREKETIEWTKTHRNETNVVWI